MYLEKGRISPQQLVFLIAGFMQGTIFVTTYTFSNTPRDEWLIVILTYAACLPFLLLYFKLSSMYEGQTLIGIHDKVYGPVIGKALSGLYCFYFIMATSGSFRFPSGFMHSIFMIETPVLVFTFFLILLCIIAIYGGIETIARVGLYTSVTVLLSLVLYFAMLLNKMNFQRFLPIMDVPPPKALQSATIIGTQYIGEVFIFSMILPYVSGKEKMVKNYIAGTALGMGTLFFISILITAVMGNVAAISTGPMIETTRHVEILGILMRTEFIFMGFLIFTAFYKCCVFLYVTLLGVAELFRLRSFKVLIIPICLLVYSMVLTSADNSVSLSTAGRNGWAFISFFMLFILPFITFVTAVIRTLPKKGGE